MRKLVLAALLLIATLFQPAEAGVFPRGTATIPPSIFNGSALMNVGDNQFANLTNVFKGCGVSASSAHPEDVFKLDADGYPTSKPNDIMLLCNPPPGTFWVDNYELAGPSTRLTPLLFLGANITGCVGNGNVVITGCSGSGNTTFRPTGGAWSVTFAVGAGGFGTMYFDIPASGSYSAGSGDIAMYRASDKTRWQAGKYFTKEYADGATRTGALCGISPGILRAMPDTMTATSFAAQNFSNQTIFSYRKKTTNFGWTGNQYPPGALIGSGGAISGTNTLTAPAAPDTPVSLTDGEVAIGIVTNANTSTTVTLDVGSRGAKPVTFASGTPPQTGGSGQIQANSLAAFVYSGTQKTWIYSPGGINWALPIEAFAQLANDCGSDAWFNLPPMATNAFITSWVDLIRDSVTGNVYFEYSNETWDSGFGIYGYGYNSGIALGWVPDSNQNIDSWYALRSKQLSDIAVAEFTSAGQISRLRPTMEYQGCCQSTGGSADNRFGGAQLIPNNPKLVTVTFTGGSPCVVNWANNGPMGAGWPVSFTSTLTLPTNVTSAHIYNVLNNNGTTFNLEDGVGTGAINCTGNGTGTITGNYTNPFYAAAGYGNYSAKPNRPIDQTYSVGGAPYLLGQSLCGGPDQGNCAVTADSGPFFQALTTAWEAGNAAAAIALVDSDARTGRNLVQNVTASGTTFTTPSPHGFSANCGTNGKCSVVFQVTGGTAYSGVTMSQLYEVTSVPTSTTFTIQAFIGGFPGGSNINAGSAGSGTMTVGYTNRQNLVLNASTYMSINEALAAKYDSDRPSSGQFTANLKGIQYEGDAELTSGFFVGVTQFPNPANCTTMGVTSASPITVSFTADTSIFNNQSMTSVSNFTNLYPGMVLTGSANVPAGTYVYAINPAAKTITLSALVTGTSTGQSMTATGNCMSNGNAAIEAWKLDNLAYLTQTSYFNAALGKDSSVPATYNSGAGLPHMKAPASLSLMCAGPYTLINGCLPTSPVNQLWNAYRDWSRTNWLLKRDMQVPGSANDNDPMWLEKAA